MIRIAEPPADAGKSFVPQLFPPGEPTNEWAPEALGYYAQSQLRQIDDGAKQLTPAYWRLGKALHFAKRNFGHGQWAKFLESWGIDRTRAARARAIFSTFATENLVHGLTVEQAYQQRKRRDSDGRRPNGHGRAAGQPLRRFISATCRKADGLVDEAAFLEPDKASALLPMVDQAIKNLRRLQEWLKRQAKVVQLSAPGASGSVAK